MLPKGIITGWWKTVASFLGRRGAGRAGGRYEEGDNDRLIAN
jgi:hypothetical protein